MPRHFRTLYAALAVLTAMVALGMARDKVSIVSVGDTPATIAPTPAATPSTSPAWLRSPIGSTRVAEIAVTLTPVREWVAQRAEVRLDIRRDDPLATEMLANEVSGRDLAGMLGLGSLYPSGDQPTIDWHRDNERARVAFELADSRPWPRDAEVDSWPLAERPPDAVGRWKVTILATAPLTIVGTDGTGLVQRDERSVTFEGPPDTLAITVRRPAADSASSFVTLDDGTMNVLEGWGRWGWLALLLLKAAPWLVLLYGLWAARRQSGLGYPVPIAVTGAAISFLAVDHLLQPVLTGTVTFAGALLLTVAMFRVARDQFWWTDNVLGPLAVAAVVAPAIAYVLVASDADYTFDVDPLELCAALLVAVLAGALAHRLAGGRPLAGGLAVVGIAGIVSLAPLEEFGSAGNAAAAAAGGALAGLVLWIGADGRPARRWSDNARLLAGAAVLLLGALMLAPVGAVTVGPAKVFGRWSPDAWRTAAIDLLSLALVVVALRYLRRRGSRPQTPDDSLTLSILLVLLLAVTIEYGDVMWLNVAAVVAAIVAWRWLTSTPAPRIVPAVLRITGAHHLRLVRAEVRRRVTHLSAHDLYRRARTELQQGNLDLREYDAAQRRLDDVASPLDKRIDGVPVALALSTGAGQTPWQNATAALTYALPLALVFAGYEAWLLISGEERFWLLQTLLGLAHILLHQLRWLGYGLIYGYAYPLLRGRTPVTKALSMVLLVVPIEVLTVLSGVPRYQDPEEQEGMIIPSPAEVLAATGIRTGQVLVFLLVLGLAWERRLANLAGYGWDRLRNVRSVRALATPAGAVIVAVATAAGTAIAGAAVAAMLTTGSTPPDYPPTPTPTPTVTP